MNVALKDSASALTLTETDGSALATAILHTHDHDHWQLWYLTVRADGRYRGIGSHLLAQYLYLAHQHGAQSLAAHTNEHDTAAARLLLAGGFTGKPTSRPSITAAPEPRARLVCRLAEPAASWPGALPSLPGLGSGYSPPGMD